MPQLHFSVSDATAQEVRRKAEDRGVSVSRYLAELVEHQLGRGWPAGWFETVVGSWQGELERPPQGELEVREEL
jgi:hypothetical protein